MNRLAALATSVLSAVVLAGPEVQIDCPAGMHFVKDKGCVANVAPKVECPGGTHFQGGKCVAIIDTSCPAGMHFVAGTGCVAGGGKKQAEASGPMEQRGEKASGPMEQRGKKASGPMEQRGKKASEAPPPPPERPEADPKKEPTGKKKGGTFSTGFSDRLSATCGGLDVEVHGGTRLTGVRAMLLVDGRKLGDEQDVNVGQTKSISGKHGKQEVQLTVQQGLWGTRYTLKVDGTECKLTK